MKTFFALLCVLYVSVLVNAGLGILIFPEPLALIKNLGDVVAGALCLRTAFDLGWSRRWLDAPGCRLLYRATGGLGIYAVILAATGTSFGPPGLFGPGLAHSAMVFVPYVLFIVPVVLQERRLAEQDGTGDARRDPRRTAS